MLLDQYSCHDPQGGYVLFAFFSIVWPFSQHWLAVYDLRQWVICFPRWLNRFRESFWVLKFDQSPIWGWWGQIQVLMIPLDWKGNLWPSWMFDRVLEAIGGFLDPWMEFLHLLNLKLTTNNIWSRWPRNGDSIISTLSGTYFMIGLPTTLCLRKQRWSNLQGSGSRLKSFSAVVKNTWDRGILNSNFEPRILD